MSSHQPIAGLFQGTLEQLGGLGMNKGTEHVLCDLGILGEQQCVARFHFEDGGIVIDTVHFGSERVDHMIDRSDMDGLAQQIEGAA